MAGGVPYKDLTNQKFGRLTAIKYLGISVWEFLCDCGNKKEVVGYSVTSGKTKSCGCLLKESNGYKSRLNLVGKNFGYLKVVALSPVRSPQQCCMWECLCKCGKTTIVMGQSLVRGITKSCGCYRVEVLSKPAGVSSQNALYCQYRYGAKKRNLEFSITINDLLKICSKNCYYCGTSPNQIINYSGPYVYNGIDRLNNDLGYTLDNCVPCCNTCNKFKSDLKVQDFYEHVKKIHAYSLQPQELQ